MTVETTAAVAASAATRAERPTLFRRGSQQGGCRRVPGEARPGLTPGSTESTPAAGLGAGPCNRGLRRQSGCRYAVLTGKCAARQGAEPRAEHRTNGEFLDASCFVLRTRRPHVSTQRPLTLLVEAEQALAEVLVQILDDMNVDAIWIREPKDALAMLNAPGQAVASALVHQDVPDPVAITHVAGRIPVVLLTDQPADYSAEALGVRCILPMPFEIKQLEAALQACLDLPMTDGAAASSDQGMMQADGWSS
jgi:hypothetical protein